MDIVRIQDAGLRTRQDAGLRTRQDAVLLEWAAEEGRLMLTHDNAAMPDEAYRRIEATLPMPGVIVVNKNLPRRQNIDDIVLLALASLEGERENRAVHLPL